MTDHLAKALQVLEPMAYTPVKGAIQHIVEHLRSSTAPERTEGNPSCRLCNNPLQFDEAYSLPGLDGRFHKSCGRRAWAQHQAKQQPSADVGEGPSDEGYRKCTMLACPLPYGHGGRCAVPSDPANPSYEYLLRIVNHGAIDSLEQRARALYNAGRSSAARELAELRENYNELLMAVGNKYEGETRHETALRYLRSCENPDRTEVGAIPQNLRPGEGEG